MTNWRKERKEVSQREKKKTDFRKRTSLGRRGHLELLRHNSNQEAKKRSFLWRWTAEGLGLSGMYKGIGRGQQSWSSGLPIPASAINSSTSDIWPWATEFVSRGFSCLLRPKVPSYYWSRAGCTGVLTALCKVSFYIT